MNRREPVAVWTRCKCPMAVGTHAGVAFHPFGNDRRLLDRRSPGEAPSRAFEPPLRSQAPRCARTHGRPANLRQHRRRVIPGTAGSHHRALPGRRTIRRHPATHRAVDRRAARLVDRHRQSQRRNRHYRRHGGKAGSCRRAHAGRGHHQHPWLDAGAQTQPGL